MSKNILEDCFILDDKFIFQRSKPYVSDQTKILKEYIKQIKYMNSIYNKYNNRTKTRSKYFAGHPDRNIKMY